MLKAQRIQGQCAAKHSAFTASCGRAHPTLAVSRAVKLYTNPGSRGKMPEWYLGELNMKYESIVLDMKAKEHKSPNFLAINPFGKVPAMEDGDLKMFESGAILLHLAFKYGNLSPEEQSLATQWVLFSNSTLSDAVFNERMRPLQMDTVLNTVDKILADKPFMLGDKFSVADVALGSYLMYIPMFFPDYDLMGKCPNIKRYITLLASRPSCPEAYKKAILG